MSIDWSMQVVYLFFGLLISLHCLIISFGAILKKFRLLVSTLLKYGKLLV